ncbi:pilus assembly protein [Hyalangium gracile]|uniref:pilus assembly protein n=1 Tax=Hyalangium gracile TaxID=394092 RepID=UPI001CC9CC22|nr:pilus assembly protein [Hyalangium gracile]
MRARSPRRGQTLVLFALTVLLVSLMVVMTLSFSVKVRERIELQTVADTTAFTNAVATARTFNNIAVLNRAQIAHGVAQLGAQSIISWTTFYRSAINAAKKAFKDSEEPYQTNKDIGCWCKETHCPPMCQCGKKGLEDLKKLQDDLQKEDDRVDKLFESMDAAAGREVFFMQLAMMAMYAEQQEVFLRLENKLEDQGFAQRILDRISEGGNRAEWSAPPGAGSVSKDEVNGGALCLDDGAVCTPLPLTVAHSVNAAMGSRGWRFTTKRTDYEAHMTKLKTVIPPPDTITLTGTGTSYFTEDGPGGMFPPYAPAASAEDEGTVRTEYNHQAHGGNAPCPLVMSASVGPDETKVELKAGPSPVHKWMDGKDSSPSSHLLTFCLGGPSSCPGVWPAFLDYNVVQVARSGNNFGQPKNVAVIMRDSSRQGADPWNERYRSPFPSQRPKTFDASLAAPKRSLAVGLSTGVAYYHRGTLIDASIPVLTGDHWSEPPNLLNPYWRATLVSMDVDKDGPKDALKALNLAGAGVHAEAFQALLQQGYGGY